MTTSDLEVVAAEDKTVGAELSIRKVENITGNPSALRFFPKAAIGGLIPSAIHRRPKTLPGTELAEEITVDTGHLARYSHVCGFTLGASLPATYPHVLAFPLHMQLMTGLSFPIPTLGLVHIHNLITQRRPISPTETLTLRVWAEKLREHPRGSEFDLVTTAASDGAVVWEERMTLLARGQKLGAPRDPRPADGPPSVVQDTAPAGARWRLPGDQGRRYAAVSGDYNLIHLHVLTSKVFGFNRPIAHGMWTAARVLAAMQGKLPPSFRYAASFKQPLSLPATVAFRVSRSADGWTATVSDARSEKLNLTAAIRPFS